MRGRGERDTERERERERERETESREGWGCVRERDLCKCKWGCVFSVMFRA